MTLPDGYRRRPVPGGVAVVDDARLAAWTRLGLDDPASWERRLGASVEDGGRGAIARVADGDERWILKRMHRGGLTARLWRGRFLGRGRLEDNVRVVAEARRRGVPTPAVVGLLAIGSPPPLWRAWLAVVAVGGAEDLARRLARGGALGEADLRAVLATVREMHDAGVEHRDLNLGNLLLDAARTVTVLDLDRARVADGALPSPARARALRRLQRSYRKLRAVHDADVDWRVESWPRTYARLGG